MKKIVIALALALSAVFVTVPAQAAPTGLTNTIAKVFVKFYYGKSAGMQRKICAAWDYNYVKTVKIFAKPLVKRGYPAKASVKGVTKGLYVVCGMPNSYKGVSA